MSGRDCAPPYVRPRRRDRFGDRFAPLESLYMFRPSRTVAGTAYVPPRDPFLSRYPSSSRLLTILYRVFSFISMGMSLKVAPPGAFATASRTFICSWPRPERSTTGSIVQTEPSG